MKDQLENELIQIIDEYGTQDIFINISNNGIVVYHYTINSGKMVSNVYKANSITIDEVNELCEKYNVGLMD